MKEDDFTYDPFQFEYASSTRKFSLRSKLMAIVLVLIFVSIPLYKISPDAFKANYVMVECGCPQTLSHGCFH